MSNQNTQIVTNITQISEALKASNIELVTFNHSAFYDNDLSQMYFNDFKNEWSELSLWFDGRNGTDYIVFFANETVMNAPHFKKSHLSKMKKDDLFDMCNLYELVAHWEDINEYKKSDLIDLMLSVSNEDYYNQHFEESSFYDLDYDFSITGYCQGDKVLIKLVGTEKDFINGNLGYVPNDKYLTNLFYDSPKHLSLDIFVNGDDYDQIDFNEHIDMYESYDKSDCIKLINEKYNEHKYFKQILNYVSENFPKDLEYI